MYTLKAGQRIYAFFAVWLLCLTANTSAQGQDIKAGLSLGQYRVQDGYASSYWMQHVSGYMKTKTLKAKVSMPYLQQDNGDSGTGNGLLKLSWLNQWQNLYVDLHVRQRLATANKAVTLPVHDRGASLEVSRFFGRTIGFAELGHWWREATQYDRQNTYFSSLGAIHIISKRWMAGGIFDHRPTAYGEIDRTLSAIVQLRLDGQNKVSLSTGRGLEADSPDWTIGLQWQYKTRF